VLYRFPEQSPSLQRFTQPTATIQVAEHGFRQYVNRLSIFRPLQLFLAGSQVFENILEPQKIAFALAHCVRPTVQGRVLSQSLKGECKQRATDAAALQFMMQLADAK
jgi:hypothetical protein